MFHNYYKMTVSSVAKRAMLAREIYAFANKIGVEVTEDVERYKERAMTLSYGDYHVAFQFDASSRCTEFLGHWYTRGSVAKYPANFPAASVNQYHFGKATVMEPTFEDFVAKLKAGFMRLMSEAN